MKLLVVIANYRVTDLTIDCLRSIADEIKRFPDVHVAVCVERRMAYYGGRIPECCVDGKRVRGKSRAIFCQARRLADKASVLQLDAHKLAKQHEATASGQRDKEAL